MKKQKKKDEELFLSPDELLIEERSILNAKALDNAIKQCLSLKEENSSSVKRKGGDGVIS